MLEIHCKGTPFEIGHQHGSQGKQKVLGSIAFYTALLQKTCALSWPDVRRKAAAYVPTLERLCPAYLEEMRGVASGAGVHELDVLALNVRTEIMFGQWAEDPALPVASDGCTAIACKGDGDGEYDDGGKGMMLLAQNWDWQAEQADSLLVLRIEQAGKPRIAMVTEGGVIGKIGLNERGVGVCLNAIRAEGVDSAKMPIHLALRAVLESDSAAQAAELVRSAGTAGSGHVLVADESEAAGLECTYLGVRTLALDADGMIVHTNHLLLEHPGVVEPAWWADSRPREKRFRELVLGAKGKGGGGGLNRASLAELFRDEEGYPASVNRCQADGCDSQTLFTIVMGGRRAEVTFGRPTDVYDRVTLAF
ncbi:hypothetical protein N3K66_006260 [Trichothecium roseum]|uniref:Uncharacterized protein n=1 Tax=Trichothecium roseum TaxID=47278 RepID=A0ACC0V057_9HYPO|nr:hypothetical protein N3K66_006260 [Trichothecium roseum]